jgi:hypothetical protein
MLVARSRGAWKQDYDITRDGAPVTVWSPKTWSSGGEFTLDGVRYTVRTNGWATSAELLDPAGRQLATAERLGRKQWTVRAGGRTHTFRRPSWWTQDQVLVVGDEEVGAVRSTGRWRAEAEADLPGLPEPVAVFVLAVVLTMWANAAVAAAAT